MTVEWQDWRVAREAGLRELRAFLSATGIHWLTGEPQRFDDVPGRWTAGDDGVRVELAEDEVLRLDGVELTGRHDFGPVDEDGVWAEFAGSSGPWSSVVEIADRFGTPILRPRHLDAPRLLGYRGTPTYAPDPRWVVEAAFEPLDAPRETVVDTVIEGGRSVFPTAGTLSFELGGQRHRVLAFDAGDQLWLLFRDATSGITTYAASRQLTAERPDADGRVVLDFNRAANMPCAYTPYATCPLPPPENVLGVAVEAGEKTPLVG